MRPVAEPSGPGTKVEVNGLEHFDLAACGAVQQGEHAQ